MQPPSPRPVVAMFNSSDDLVEMVRILLEHHGYLLAAAHINDLRRGSFDLRAFLDQHRPAAVIYDLVPPYDRQWAFLDHLRANSPLADLPLILTSSNAARARELAGRDEHVIEVVGRPFDFEQVLEAVRRVVPAAPQPAADFPWAGLGHRDAVDDPDGQ